MSKRLLIVDDERDLTDALALSLSMGSEYEVSVAYDGEEGLRQAALVRPDAILLDISMPVMDGWEMCRRLRREPAAKDTPLVVMTAGSAKDLREKAAAVRAYKVLLKPLDDEELRDALRACTEAPARP